MKKTIKDISEPGWYYDIFVYDNFMASRKVFTIQDGEDEFVLIASPSAAEEIAEAVLEWAKERRK